MKGNLPMKSRRISTTWPTALLLTGALLASAFSPLTVDPPPNDDFASATVIGSIPYNPLPLDTTAATSDVTDPTVPNCNLAAGVATVWYQYAPAGAETVYLDTFGSDYDTFIAVWTGTEGSLTAVGCNDDASGSFQSGLKVNFTGGVTYSIEVAQFSGSSAALGAQSKPVPEVGPQAGGSMNFHATACSAGGSVSINPPGSLNFGNQLKYATSSPQSVTMTNQSSDRCIQVGALSTTNSQFTFSSDTCSNQGIGPNGGSCTVGLVFKPTSTGVKNATLNIPSDATGNPHSRSLTGTGVAGTQLLLNRSFETDSNGDKLPNNWTGVGLNLSQDGRTSQFAKNLTYSFKMVGAGSNPNKIVRQSVLKNGVAGDDFLVGVWSKAENVPSGGKYRVTVVILNGSTVLLSRTVSFVNGTHSWQLRQKSITAPSAYTKIRVDIYLQKTSGMAWFDLASLTWAP